VDRRHRYLSAGALIIATIAKEMAERIDSYRVELRGLKEWEPYLKKHSGLPGPRANLELVRAVGEEADPDRLWRLSASSDEFLALCGTAGLGRVALMEPETVMTWLRELASDPRWRVREGVAMALQHMGRENMPRLLADMQEWSVGEPYVQRAAAAGLCEPELLEERQHAVQVLAILDRITTSLASAEHRRSDGFRVLRQALGYAWSVAGAAAPENARPYLEKWMRFKDKDVAWIMKENLSKARMADLAAELSSPRPAPRAKPNPKAKSKATPKPKPKAKTKSPAKPKPKTKPRK
jgi:hypothetical protein